MGSLHFRIKEVSVLSLIGYSCADPKADPCLCYVSQVDERPRRYMQMRYMG